MKSRISQFLLLGFVTACSASDDGIWFPAEDPGGKADAFTTIDGNDIPSTNVDANKKYLLVRRIDSLQTVGALDMVQDPLVRRIDGIIANMPADGRIHLAELVRMETPHIFNSLFPAEQAALPQLWKMMEAPATNTPLVGTGASFGLVDDSVPPGPAVVPASLAINTLAADLQDPARRLQNVFNGDNNTATVQLPDADKAVAMPQAFTPAEIQAFQRLQLLFRELATVNSTAQMAVSPTPGTYTKDEMLGPIGVHVDGVTRIDEERTSNTSFQFTVRMTATQTQTTTLALPQDSKLLVIEKGASGESTTAGGVFDIGGGEYVVELWKAGQRTFSTNLHTPPLTTNKTLDLTNNVDYTLATAFAPLVRNVRSAAFAGSVWTLKATYDKTAIAPTTLDQNTVTRTASPLVKIPQGRYTVQQYALLVYPNNVLWVQTGNQMFRLLPMQVSGLASPTRYRNAQINVSFDTVNNVFQTPQGSFTLLASSRDI